MHRLSRRSLARVLQLVLTVSWYIVLARLGLEVIQIVAVYFDWLTSYPGFFKPLGEFASLLGAAVLAPQYYAHAPQSYANMMLARLVLVDLPPSLTILYVIRAVGQMCSTLITERPFIAENAAGVRRIGLAFLALTAWNWGIRLLLAVSMLARGAALQVRPELTVVPDLGTTLFGILLLIMAEVFRHGAELQEDQDLTV